MLPAYLPTLHLMLSILRMADIQTLEDDPGSYDMMLDDWEDVLSSGHDTGSTSLFTQDRPSESQQLQCDFMSSREGTATDALARHEATPKATRRPTPDSCSTDTLMQELQSLSFDSPTPSQQNADDSYAQTSARLFHAPSNTLQR